MAMGLKHFMKKTLVGLIALSQACVPSPAFSSVSVTVNGTSYTIPQTNEKGWGNNVTTWIQGISSNTLQPTGGSFTLSNDINFGSSFGLLGPYFTSTSSNPSSSGVFRLSNSDGIGFRNSSNSTNYLLKPDADGFLQYNSIDLVNLSGTQALTNKTISGASNTITNVSLSTGVTGTLPIANGGTGQTGATAAFNALHPMTTTGDMIYSSSGTTAARLPVGAANQVLKVVSGSPAWAAAPTGGVNYIQSNPDAEADTSGWTTYSNTAKNIPANGTGGSPNSTWTRTTSSPLRGSGSFLWTKAGSANRQGEGVAFPFTIDNADQAKPLAITFDYTVASGTFTASDGTTAPLNDNTTSTNAGNSDLEVFIYDVTNSALIPVTPQVLTGNQSSQYTYKAVFQTASNSTSYRLILHTATTTTNNFTVKFDNFFVGPQSVSYGAPVSDWTSYTPTTQGLGTISSSNAFWRRVGDSLEIGGYFTTGTVTGSTAQISLPSGFTIDSTKVPSTTVVGIVTRGANGNSLLNTLASGGNTYITIGVQTGSSTGLTSQPGNGIFGNSEVISFTAKVPISGWSSTVLMSNDASTQVVAAIVALASAVTPGANANIKYDTVIADSAGGYSVSTGNYTVPVSGYYRVAVVGENSTSAMNYLLTQNGTQKYYLFTVPSGSIGSGAATLKCVAGDTISIQVGGANQVNGGSPYQNVMSIERVSGPSAIAASENIRLQYTGNSGAALTGDVTNMDFSTKVIDSHGAWSGTVFTAPRPDFYSFTGACQFTAGSNNLIYAWVNGSKTLRVDDNNTAGSVTYPSIKGAIYLKAGDTLSFRPNGNWTESNSATLHWISIWSQ